MRELAGHVCLGRPASIRALEERESERASRRALEEPLIVSVRPRAPAPVEDVVSPFESKTSTTSSGTG